MNSARRGNRFILILLIIMIVGSYAIGFFALNFQVEINHVNSILIPQFIFIAVPIILYFIITKSPVKETLLLKKLDMINILLTIGVGLFIQPFLGLVNIISQLFFENQISGAVMGLMDLPLWLLLFLVAVVPAVNEEIVTRGILLTNYRNVNIYKAALVSGLSFGMLHLNGNQFSYAFVMGIILFIFVKITGSIYSSMIIHFLINGLQMILAKISIVLQELLEKSFGYEAVVPETVEAGTILSLLPMSIFFTAATLPFVILFFYLAIRYNKKQNLFTRRTFDDSMASPKPREKVFDAYLITSIVIFIAFVFINEILF